MTAAAGDRVVIVGGGLAGCEAAWQLARAGIDVDLYEMRPQRGTAAHTTGQLAELVCSNSFRNATLETAVGLLKEEMRRAGFAGDARGRRAPRAGGGLPGRRPDWIRRAR